MSDRAVRRQCRQLVATLDVPMPFDARRLADRVAAERVRPIDLIALAMPNNALCGIWLATPDRDIIVYEQNTSRLHQEHIQLHEICHILCQHDPVGTTNPQISRLLFPDLDPHVVHRSLHRSHYSLRQEQEVETLASMILARARRLRPVPEWQAPPDAAQLRQRIASSLEPPADGS
jgi:hypothetical protein